ncbi:MAG: AAA family ATPase, partial [Planctomycetia bacterium]
MIRQVAIKNFKCLRDVTVNLERFTVFVGANGSGKTSFLQAIDLLCRAFRGQPGQLEGEFEKNRSHGTTEEVELSCQSGETHFRTRINSPPLKKKLGRFTKRDDEGAAFANDGNPLDWKQWQPEQGELPNSVWLRLDPNALRTPGPANQADPRLMLPNGSGMHAATAAMHLEEADVWPKLQDDLRQIVPSIRRLRHTPRNELLFDTVNARGLMADQVSEGTLLTLGLLLRRQITSSERCHQPVSGVMCTAPPDGRSTRRPSPEARGG